MSDEQEPATGRMSGKSEEAARVLRDQMPAVHATVDELVALLRENKLEGVFDHLKTLDPAELAMVVLWLISHVHVCESLHTPAELLLPLEGAVLN